MKIATFLTLATLLGASAEALAGSDKKSGQSPGQAARRIETAQRQPYGEFVTDGKGRPVYLFMKDQGAGNESTCYGECAEVWPPVLAGEGKLALGEEIDRSKLGTIERKDGSEQITYGGWPLYYYVKDRGTQRITGHDVMSFGAEWYLVTPEGQKVKAHG